VKNLILIGFHLLYESQIQLIDKITYIIHQYFSY